MKTKLAGMGGAPAQTFVDDVFSTYLYTGTGNSVTQRIASGIDLATKGGMVWVKNRTEATDHQIYDTARGEQKYIRSNTTDAEFNSGANQVQYKTSGWDAFEYTNTLNKVMTSWTFRKAAKFFDVVTYTGTGGANIINHNLGVPPGCIIVKRTDLAGNWGVWHRGNGGNTDVTGLSLNTTAAAVLPNFGQTASFTSTSWPAAYVYASDNSNMNINGATYVAYLFAHDTSSTGIIQCGSFTTDGSGNATVNLGWEPQYLMNKKSSNIDNWQIFDQMRGFNATGATSALLRANIAGEEYVGLDIHPTATGFNTVGFAASTTYIYMAIRRPNKPPTSGTQVYQGVVTGGNNFPYVTTNTVVDFAIRRANKATAQSYTASSRLTGDSYLLTTTSDAETAGGGIFTFDSMSGWYNTTLSATPVVWNFKRAPGFFDEVCYTGTGVARTVAHNLTVAPEFIIVKNRSNVNNWPTYSAYVVQEAQYRLLLNNTSGASPSGESVWGATPTTVPNMTSTTFSLGTEGKVNTSLYTYVAYLFATLAGISKVGSYTGNGSTGQAIACGFSAGARFVLIKRTDSTGGWYTFDSARGLISVSSPYLLLNSTAAEVTGNNGVYASTGGFTLGSTASTTTNINAATYIFLAVA